VGISFGGEIAVACAARHPDRIDALVLISATGMGRRRSLATSALLRNILGFVLKRWVLQSLWMTEMISRRVYYDISRRPPDLAGLFHREMGEVRKREAWLEAFWQTLDPPKEFRRWLKELRIPVLLLWGENDRAVPLKFAREFKSLAADCRLVTVPACAHAMPLEQPEVLCNEVRKFLARPQSA
jgi:pimeloyl-ACP methyl ester carboxylesterase